MQHNDEMNIVAHSNMIILWGNIKNSSAVKCQNQNNADFEQVPSVRISALYSDFGTVLVPTCWKPNANKCP